MTGLPNARAVEDARQLPALRSQLLDFATPGGVWEQTEVERAMTEVIGGGTARTVETPGGGISRILEGPRGFARDQIGPVMTVAAERGRRSMDWHRRVITDAQLIYVTADLVDVVEQAAAAVPDELTITLDDLPAPYGLVVLARSLEGTDAGPERPGGVVRFDAIQWGTAKLPAPDCDWLGPDVTYTVDCLAIGTLRWMTPEQHDDLSELFDRTGWVPLGRSDWPYGTTVDYRHRDDITDVSLTSMVEDRRVIAALFAILNQRRLIDTMTVTAPRHEHRQAARRGRTHPDVVVVHLRRSESRPSEQHEPGRKVGVRFPVRPFYRRQPYGPRAEGKRRLVLVPGHWRGPDGAPVVHAERVWSLDR